MRGAIFEIDFPIDGSEAKLLVEFPFVDLGVDDGFSCPEFPCFAH